MSEPENTNPTPKDDAISGVPPVSNEITPAPQKKEEATPPPPVPVLPAKQQLKPPTSNDPISRFRNKTEDEDARMGFIDHLLELRKRLWISVVAVMICVTVSLIFYKPIYNFLLDPIRRVDAEQVKKLTEAGKPPVDGHVIQITTCLLYTSPSPRD